MTSFASHKKETSNAVSPVSKHKQAVSVNVKVDRATRPKPATPTQSTTSAPFAGKPKLKKSRSSRPPSVRPSIHQLPIEQRKRLMWGFVAGGMFLVLLGWALSLGRELRQNNREPGLFSQLTNLFQSYRTPQPNASPRDQEIRNLEEQVFPQF